MKVLNLIKVFYNQSPQMRLQSWLCNTVLFHFY